MLLRTVRARPQAPVTVVDPLVMVRFMVVVKVLLAVEVAPILMAISGLSASPGTVNSWLAQAGQFLEDVVKKAFAASAEGNNTTTWVTSGSSSFDPGGR